MAHIGKLRFNWRGVWVSGTNYKPDDMVQYKGQTYICNANTSSTTSPQDRLSTNSDNPGSAGTDWTLYSHSGLGGDANRGETGYKSSNTFMFGTSRSSHGHLTNSYWRSGTYYHGDNVQYIANNGVSGTYRVKVASTTLPPANNTLNPTSDWDRIAFGTSSYNKTALVHPDCWEPFPNQGYILRKNWSGNNMTGNSTPAWYGDTYGYGVTDATQYFHGGCCFVNKNYLPVTVPGDSIASGGSAPPFQEADNDFATSEVPFRHLDYLDGVLPTPDGEPPKCTMLLKDYAGILVLFNNGEVHYYGDNSDGQAGRGTVTDDSVGAFNRWGYANVNRTGETKVMRGKKAIRIAMTLGYTTNLATATYALIENSANNTNEIYGCGHAGYGQLATGADVATDLTVPTLMTTGANGWDQAAFGNPVDIWATGGTYGRIWALTQTGKMYACGYNAHGQLGVGNTTSPTSTWTLVKDWGTVGGIKKFATTGNQYNVCAVVAGNGTLWTWGENAAGALGQGDTTDRTSPTQVGSDTDWQNCWVFCGHTTTSFVTFATKGTSQTVNDIYASGDGANYVLGQGNTTDQNSFVQPLDSYGNTISNIVNVKAIGGTGSAHISIGLEQYVADTTIANQNGYKTRWYMQGDIYTGLFDVGYANLAANNLDADLPKPSASSTEQYYYHQNLRFFPGVNPYRVSLQARGYSTTTGAVLYFDKDVGRVIHSGAGYFGLDVQSAPGDQPTEGTDVETLAVSVHLPGN